MLKYISIILTTLFIYFNHPLMMTVTLILQALITCMMMGTILKNFWLPYMLLIIMLGGLMIMFMYMCSTTPNQIMITSPMMTIPFIMLSPIFTKSTTNLHNHANSSNNMNFFNLMMNIPNHLMFPTLMMILLFTMFAVMKISYSSESPLRSMN